jgi:FolB domain-containing protein
VTHRDRITLSGLHVECIVGVYPNERDILQPIRLDADLFYDSERAAKSERVRDTVNYHAIAGQIVFLLQSCRFRLLETAAHVLARYLLAPPAIGESRSQVDELRLKLEKPGALRGAASPSLEIRRTAADVELAHEAKSFGTVDIVHETKDAGIYRLNVAPKKGIALHLHRVMRESEMVLGNELLVNGKRVKPGTVYRWPPGAAHRYDNPSDRWQTILCVDSPAFIPDDEVETEGEPSDVPAEPVWTYRGHS